jgi:hypothetical protein
MSLCLPELAGGAVSNFFTAEFAAAAAAFSTLTLHLI